MLLVVKRCVCGSTQCGRVARLCCAHRTGRGGRLRCGGCGDFLRPHGVSTVRCRRVARGGEVGGWRSRGQAAQACPQRSSLYSRKDSGRATGTDKFWTKDDVPSQTLPAEQLGRVRKLWVSLLESCAVVAKSDLLPIDKLRIDDWVRAQFCWTYCMLTNYEPRATHTTCVCKFKLKAVP